ISGDPLQTQAQVLAFGYNNDRAVNAVGVGHPARRGVSPPGPCIAGAIDLRDQSHLEEGMIIEEGVLPSGLAPLLPGIFSAGFHLTGKDTDQGLADGALEAARRAKSWVLGAYWGAMQHTETFLVMAHDDAGGRIELDDGRLTVRWPGVAEQPIYRTIEATLTKATAATGGAFVRNPLQSTQIVGKTLVTVHPLGGCPMGADASRGVVDHACRVFDPAGGVHEGLLVCDGAVMPRPLGVNPLFTISAIAERAMIELARRENRPLSDAPRADARLRKLVGDEDDRRPAGVEFTERMAGFLSTASADYQSGMAAGKSAGTEFAFTATIRVDDIARFESDPEHAGRISGTALCPQLSADPLDIADGRFNLMRPDPTRVETRRFDYQMQLISRDGRRFRFAGHKVVRADAGVTDLWRDTTTLFVDLVEETGTGATAKGILTIAATDFARQLTTLKGTGGGSIKERLSAVGRFGGVFAGTLFDVYGGLAAPLKRYDGTIVRKKRALRTPHPEVHEFAALDGRKLRLTRYHGGDKGPLLFSHGLGVSSLIFSIDTIDTNLLEFMVAAGYDCWLLDFRASTDLPHARDRWTADDCATKDYQPAVDLIREKSGATSVQVIAHCFGATTFVMAMLSGLKGVRSAVISQIATDVIVPFWPQRALAYLRTPSLFSLLGIGHVNARATKEAGVAERLMDGLIRIAVPFQRDERTRNATSNRITALYGQLYETAQLDADTFEFGLAEMFGPANIDAFKQLALIARRQVIVNAAGEDVYLPHLERLAIPITIIHGANNACFRPESTVRTLERLTKRNGASFYQRHEIAGYGHIDCIFGKRAAVDVYPIMLAHFEPTALHRV
ncbi:MAG TPA: GMC oxidoreductase, partial [Hyphomicrobiaceae bacterium]|nr:GMC oxidoreductase [Hyphomicrobiaceae bacterium]